MQRFQNRPQIQNRLGAQNRLGLHNRPQQQTGPTAARDAKKQLEREIDLLSKSIQTYRIDIQRYLGGELKIPPDEQREKIATEIRRLQSGKQAGAVEKYRLASLEAQFNSHSELFGRRLRERERGDRIKRRDDAAPALDPERGVVIGAKPSTEAVEALYKSMYLRTGSATPQVDLERFRSHLSRQAETICAKAGCSKIQFRVAEEDGKLKIKAKPIRA